MVDIWSKEKRSEVMSKVRSGNTKPEILLRKALFTKGYRYRLHCKKLAGKPDIIFPKYRTVIFVHGCFWHHHQACRKGCIPSSNSNFWTEKLSKNIQRDLRNQKALMDDGWSVIIVWECEIKQMDSLLPRIETKLFDKYKLH